MKQVDLVQKLDAFFDVQAFDEQARWTEYLPSGALDMYQRQVLPEFVNGPWNGLMIDNAEEVDRVYMVVFPGKAALDTILALELEREAPGSLIFAHHPSDFEESGRGFWGVDEDQIEELAEHHISMYCCHAPLDCHPEISTVTALAKALKLRDWQRFSPHHGCREGVHGRVSDTDFTRFVQQVADATELPYVRYSQLRHNGQPVEHVAVIPGGGDNPGQLEAIRDLGCDTYVTGHWWLVGEYDYAEEQRQRMRDLVPHLPMNLIGTSHYASEMLVLRDQMPAWFRNAGIEARLIKQPDPWY